MRLLHERLYAHEFARVVPWARRFRGVYTTFEEATRAAPATKPVGYNNPGAARFMQPCRELSISDYPVLFWLQKTFQESPTLLDIGGYVGISYYTYQRYLSYPENLMWVIQDVPAVIAAGAEVARLQNSPGLSFVAEITSDLKCQTVLADGSLQFIEKPFSDLLTQMNSLPKHLIVSKMPFTDLPDFITLQDLGPAVCPYKIFNRAKFIESVESLGYKLVDSWTNSELGCRIPFYRKHTIPSYSGMYFQSTKNSAGC
jgi:putative methyltransferase (TIGR04325 family)